MNKINIELEMRALDAERVGMEAANQNSLHIGNGTVYDEFKFFALAEQYRKLKKAENMLKRIGSTRHINPDDVVMATESSSSSNARFYHVWLRGINDPIRISEDEYRMLMRVSQEAD